MPNAAKVKGRFEQVKRDVYRKVGKPGKWLFVAKTGRRQTNGKWMVGNTEWKEARGAAWPWAHSVASAGGMPPPAGAGRWQVLAGSTWVEQTVEDRHG